MADKADWSGALGAEWARNAATMERMLGDFGMDAMRALGPIRGETILDLGCGGGATTYALARRAGAYGAAVGVDVSPDLISLAAARRAAQAAVPKRAGFLCADAAEARFGQPFDALFSQFGAMFFAAPVPAFAHLRRSMRPGARAAIACWRAPRENDWAMLALNAAKPLLPEAPKIARGAPGPFSWAVPEETFGPILETAGWKDVSWRAVDHELTLGEGLKGDTGVDRAVAFSMKIGPLASRLKSVKKKKRKEIREVVRDALAARADGGEVKVRGAGWLVEARA